VVVNYDFVAVVENFAAAIFVVVVEQDLLGDIHHAFALQHELLV
jgi:hypothetical protein